MLTIAYPGTKYALARLALASVAGIVDWINVMAYDAINPAHDFVTAHHLPMNPSPDSPYKGLSVLEQVANLKEDGIPFHKIVLCVAYSGRAWANVTINPQATYALADFGLFAPARGAFSIHGESPGVIPYKWIESNLRPNPAWGRVWDRRSSAAFLYNAEQGIFLSYEEERSIRVKALFVKDQGLRGIGAWQYADDYRDRLQTAVTRALGHDRRPTLSSSLENSRR